MEEDFIRTQVTSDNFNSILAKSIAYRAEKQAQNKTLPEDSEVKISNALDDATRYLKSELLNKSYQELKKIFSEYSIDEIIEYHQFHTDGVENAHDILSAVKTILDNNDTLKSVQGLTIDVDWKRVVDEWYNLINNSSTKQQEQPAEQNQLYFAVDEKEISTKRLKLDHIRNAFYHVGENEYKMQDQDDARENYDEHIDVGLALYMKRHRPSIIERHLPTIEILKAFGKQFLYTLYDSNELIEFLYASLVTATNNKFTDMTCEECVKTITDIFQLEPSKETHLLQRVVRKIYDYFTEQQSIKMTNVKQIFLNANNIEFDEDGDEIDLGDVIDSQKDTLETQYKNKHEYVYLIQLLYAIRIVSNNGDTLQDIPDLTIDSDWKKQILEHYDLTTVEYRNPQVQVNSIDNTDEDDEAMFDEDDEDMKKFTERMNAEGPFKLGEELYKELLEQTIHDEKTNGGRKGGKASKQNCKRAITIVDTLKDKQYTFEMRKECMEFIGINNRKTFSEFLKGKSKLNKRWKIVENQ